MKRIPLWTPTNAKEGENTGKTNIPSTPFLIFSASKTKEDESALFME